MNEEEKRKMTQEDSLKLLDEIYNRCINGIPKVSQSVEEMANDYLKKIKTREAACKLMLRVFCQAFS